MPFSRYARTSLLNLGAQFGTNEAAVIIRQAIANNQIKTRQIVVRGVSRLDTLAGEVYGDARYWWVLAAASDVGWGLQCPPGTIIKIPDLADVSAIVG